MDYRIGIDVGSKTVKLVVLDRQNGIVYSSYQRHGANIRETLKDVLHTAQWRTEDFRGTVGVTGSAGIEVSEMLGLPFVQEVVGTTRAVQTLIPQADAIIELGGEDAKVIYLSGGLEQRMNATCAGGTGGFIDTMAYMLGVRTNQMSNLALGSNRTYPIASRCAVFAQTDVRPLLNAGARKADIAASVFDAVVKQTIGGLACGRPIEGTVVFLGGPLQFNAELVRRFSMALGLSREQTVKPADAHLFTAIGAAIMGADQAEPAIRSLSQLEAALERPYEMGREIARLPRLFDSADDYEAFKHRHACRTVERTRLCDVTGPVFAGIDAGSTTMKLAVLDEHDRLCYSDYRFIEGDVLETASSMLRDMYRAFPHPYNDREHPFVHVAHATATGYGEDLLRCAFGVDSGIVETAAHLRAALRICPDATFLLDIGGQDIKAIWVRNGEVADAVLNEACSSGCGAFLSGMAHSLHCSPAGFGEAAVHAENPLDLGVKCTVFMTSRVRHAQKIGADRGDIAAGLAYSVVGNALYKIIGMRDVASMGAHIVVSGGTFLSDAVLRAFELTAGVHVLRPETAELQGAIGAALAAHERARGDARSTLLDAHQLDRLTRTQTNERCPGCANACPISIIAFEDTAPDEQDAPAARRLFITGNRCERAYGFFEGSAPLRRAGRRAPDLYALEQQLIGRFRSDGADAQGGVPLRCTVGLPRTMHLYESTPFWFTLLHELGFRVCTPADGADAEAPGANRTDAGGLETVFSESVCYPAKMTHLQMADLFRHNVDAVFMPHFERGNRCPVSSLYALAVGESLPAFAEGRVAFASPELESIRPQKIAASPHDRATLRASLESLAQGAPIADGAFDAALDAAVAAQEAFDESLARATRTALVWMEEHDAQGIVLAGRPYHVAAQASHGIDVMLRDRGYAVLSPAGIDMLRPDERREAERMLDGVLPCAWKPAKTLLKTAAFAAAHPRLHLVALYSFGCGYDAVTFDIARDFMESHGESFTALKIDEITDLAHVRIRLRTLDEMIAQRATFERGKKPNALATADDTRPTGNGDHAPHSCSQRVEDLCRIDADDLLAARKSVTDDVCLVAGALAGAIIDRATSDDPPAVLRIPQVCESCLVDAVPLLAERACSAIPRIEWVDRWPGPASAPASDTAGATRIGVLGNALFCFDETMNRNLEDYLRRQGCAAVFPQPDALFDDDITYETQIAAFAANGVDHIIYLQAFGCLKGHVQSRGALRRLQRRFPRLHLTVIDYDANASLLNQENRILLAIDAAKRDPHAGAGATPETR